MAVICIEYGTLAIEVCLLFNFVVVVSSTYFLFRQKNRRLLGDLHVNRQSAPNCSVRFPISSWKEMEMYMRLIVEGDGDGEEEGEGDRDVRQIRRTKISKERWRYRDKQCKLKLSPCQNIGTPMPSAPLVDTDRIQCGFNFQIIFRRFFSCLALHYLWRRVHGCAISMGGLCSVRLA
jgi:hypothetical protein